MVLEVLEMSRQERKEQEEKLLNFDVDEEVSRQQNQLKWLETARTAFFFLGIISAVVSIFFTKWVVLILALVGALLSFPFKYVVKIFPNNQKLFSFLYPQFIAEEHNIELIENDDINSKNFIKRKKAKKEVLENRKAAQNEVNKVFNNAIILRIFSLMLAFVFVLISFMMYIPESSSDSTLEDATETTTTITTTETTTETTTTITTTETTTETTEPTTEETIHIQGISSVELEVGEEDSINFYREYRSDELADDLEVQVIVEDESVASAEIQKAEYVYDYIVSIKAKKKGKTKISFKPSKSNYIFDEISLTVVEPETESTTKDNSRTVYITPNGECYHFDPDCGGANSYSVSLNKAKDMGKRPCDKCT